MKGSKLYSIARLKCPRCHKGGLFVHTNAYRMTVKEDMPDKCPVCDENFFPEPGFYYGAMYVSYALTIVLSFAVFSIMTLICDFGIVSFLITNALVILMLFPLVFRYSRAIWINLFVKYDRAWSDD